MKTNIFRAGAFLVGVSSLLFLNPALAADATSEGSSSAYSPSTAPKLPYGVEDVLKLSRAQVSEDVVLNFIQNSGTIYNLSPTDIIYLKNEGVSDRVVAAMLDQRRKVPEAAAQTSTTAASAPASPTPAPATTAADAQPAPVYAQPAPEPAPSTVYTIPYPAASAAYYGAYTPYYGYSWPYYGYSWPYARGYYCGPGVSFGFGFGSGAYHHYHHSHRH